MCLTSILNFKERTSAKFGLGWGKNQDYEAANQELLLNSLNKIQYNALNSPDDSQRNLPKFYRGATGGFSVDKNWFLFLLGQHLSSPSSKKSDDSSKIHSRSYTNEQKWIVSIRLTVKKKESYHLVDQDGKKEVLQ